MILDRLRFSDRYQALHAGFVQAFDFLKSRDLEKLESGEYEIDGRRVYAILAENEARPAEEAVLEAHREYIDIQYVVSGTDHMGWKHSSLCEDPAGEYDADTDVVFFRDQPEIWVAVPAGAFTVFFPEDAHAPLVGEGPIRKVVVKVAVQSEP